MINNFLKIALFPVRPHNQESLADVWTVSSLSAKEMLDMNELLAVADS